MSTGTMDMKDITRRSCLMFLMAFLALSALFFLPAGTLAYWHGWVYMGLLLTPMAFVLRFLRHSPHLLERRMQMRGRERTQKRLVGSPRSTSWPRSPCQASISAGAGRPCPCGSSSLAISLFCSATDHHPVFVENRYASRTVEVGRRPAGDQHGPYAIVRHPMYVGVLVMYLATPVALGSWWALLPAAVIVPDPGRSHPERGAGARAGPAWVQGVQAEDEIQATAGDMVGRLHSGTAVARGARVNMVLGFRRPTQH